MEGGGFAPVKQEVKKLTIVAVRPALLPHALLQGHNRWQVSLKDIALFAKVGYSTGRSTGACFDVDAT